MKVVILNEILRFNTLYEPRSINDSDKKRYNAAFLLKKGGESDKKIRAAIDAVCEEKFGKTWKAKVKQLESQVTKCCYVPAELKGDHEGCTEDYMFLAANRQESKGAPLVVDRAKQDLPAGKMVNGDIVNAVVDIWAQSGENPGIRCELQVVQFVKQGEPFEDAHVTTDDLPDLSEDITEDDTDGDDDLV